MERISQGRMVETTGSRGYVQGIVCISYPLRNLSCYLFHSSFVVLQCVCPLRTFAPVIEPTLLMIIHGFAQCLLNRKSLTTITSIIHLFTLVRTTKAGFLPLSSTKNSMPPTTISLHSPPFPPTSSSILSCNTSFTALLYTPALRLLATSSPTSSQSTCFITLSATRFSSSHEILIASSFSFLFLFFLFDSCSPSNGGGGGCSSWRGW